MPRPASRSPSPAKQPRPPRAVQARLLQAPAHPPRRPSATRDSEAEYALGLLCEFMRDEACDPKFRAACASLVLDRLQGKPAPRRPDPPASALIIILDDLRPEEAAE